MDRHATGGGGGGLRGGREVRYIIDYYHDASRADADGLPALRDKDTVRSIRLDVRPAPDSVEVGARP